MASGERHSQLHDVFEPMDIRTALVDIPELCDPIFGFKAEQFKLEISSLCLNGTQPLRSELAEILIEQFIPFFRKGECCASVGTLLILYSTRSRSVL